MRLQDSPPLFGSLFRTGQILKQRMNILGRDSRAASGEMLRRIEQRHQTFWAAPDAQEIVRFRLLATDSLEAWQRPRHWQRRLSNKHNAREFAKRHGCRVPELYWRGSDLMELNWASLPKHYVIRATFGESGRGAYLMSEGVNLMERKTYSPGELRTALAVNRQMNPGVEFLVEQFVRDESGRYGIPHGYTFFTFAGEIACIQVIHRSGPHAGTASTFDAEWKPLPSIGGDYPPGPAAERPKCLDEMVTRARALSQTYGNFVALSFHASDEGAFFGDFSPAPGRGRAFTDQGDRLLVDYWDRYCPGLI